MKHYKNIFRHWSRSVMVAAVLALAWTGSGQPVAAQEAVAKHFPIAVIDIQKIQLESKAAQSIKAQFVVPVEALEARIKEKEVEYTKLSKTIESSKAILSEAEFRKRAEQFNQDYLAEKRQIQASKAKLDKSLVEARRVLQKAALEQVSELAKQRGIVLVLPTTQVYIAAQDIDVTQDVMQMLDVKLPEIKVSIPE